MKHLTWIAALMLVLCAAVAFADQPVPMAADLIAPTALDVEAPAEVDASAGDLLGLPAWMLGGDLQFMTEGDPPGTTCETQSCPWENCNPSDCAYQCWKDHLPEFCACPDGDYLCRISAQNSMRLCIRGCPI